MHHAMATGSSGTSTSMGGRWGGGVSRVQKMPVFAPLDKSRLTWLTHEERTFHIFYQLSQNKVLHTLPDSFRNFKTPLSTNASRHGSWLDLRFNEHGRKVRGRGGGYQECKNACICAAQQVPPYWVHPCISKVTISLTALRSLNSLKWSDMT